MTKLSEESNQIQDIIYNKITTLRAQYIQLVSKEIDGKEFDKVVYSIRRPVRSELLVMDPLR